jgi:hypothetical protein
MELAYDLTVSPITRQTFRLREVFFKYCSLPEVSPCVRIFSVSGPLTTAGPIPPHGIEALPQDFGLRPSPHSSKHKVELEPHTKQFSSIIEQAGNIQCQPETTIGF